MEKEKKPINYTFKAGIFIIALLAILALPFFLGGLGTSAVVETKTPNLLIAIPILVVVAVIILVLNKINFETK